MGSEKSSKADPSAEGSTWLVLFNSLLEFLGALSELLSRSESKAWTSKMGQRFSLLGFPLKPPPPKKKGRKEQEK